MIEHPTRLLQRNNVMKSLMFAFCVVFACGDLGAETNVWQPSAGHVQIAIWSGEMGEATNGTIY